MNLCCWFVSHATRKLRDEAITKNIASAAVPKNISVLTENIKKKDARTPELTTQPTRKKSASVIAFVTGKNGKQSWQDVGAGTGKTEKRDWNKCDCTI